MSYLHLVDSSLQKKGWRRVQPIVQIRPLVDHLFCRVSAILSTSTWIISGWDDLPKKANQIWHESLHELWSQNGLRTWHSKFALENASPHLCTPRALAIGWWWTFLAPTLERGTGSYRLLLYKSSSFHWPSCQEDICHRYYLSEQMKLPRSLEELQ